MWLSRFDYCTVPDFDQDLIRAYIANTIQAAAEANINMVFFQVRGSGDAYYASDLEPWGPLLTGNLGGDPGWDPLEYAIDEAHANGLELHAWLNTFPAWRGVEPPPETVPMSPLLQHPDWVITDSTGQPLPLTEGYTNFSPGIPEVHNHIIAVALDIAARYEVDGIHFDYIRYPEWANVERYSRDSISVARFNSVQGNSARLDWDDWQREQVTAFITSAYNSLTSLKPELKISAAVIGSYVKAGWNAYNVVYQDPRRWSELGKIDFIAPMIYWARNSPSQPFTTRAVEWQEHYLLDRYSFAGIGSYRYVDSDKYTWAEVEGQINDLRKHGMKGMVFFSSRSLENHWRDLVTGQFVYPAKIPAMPWKDNTIPGVPVGLQLVQGRDEITLTWVAPESSDVRRFCIYWSENLPVDQSKAESLIAVTHDDRLEWRFNSNSLASGYLVVTSLNAAWNESQPSRPIRILVPDR